MKKYIACMLLAGMMAVPSVAEAAYSSTEEITLEELQKITSPKEMLKVKSGVCLEYSEIGIGEYEGQNLDVITNYELKDGIYYYNSTGIYNDGLSMEEYVSGDPEDLYAYLVDDGNVTRQQITLADVDGICSRSVFSFEIFDAQLVSVEDAQTEYVATIEYTLNDQIVERDVLQIDAESGYVTGAQIVFMVDGKELASREVTLTYSDDITADDAAKKAYEDLPEEAKAVPSGDGKVEFTTTDVDGNEVTAEIMKDAKVVMVNFWEPWCGPCVGEMPELEKLYEKYSQEGLLILGVYSDKDHEETKAIIEDIGITYPIIRCDEKLAAFQTDYVPTTIFADADGNVLTDESVIGANSYEDWEKMITEYLK